jgi:hypothetical protein
MRRLAGRYWWIPLWVYAVLAGWLGGSWTMAGPTGDQPLAQNGSENGKAKDEPIPPWDIYRRQYEIKKAALKAALADSVAADKTRDETRERWIAAERLFNQRALSEEELRMAELVLDSKTAEAVSKRTVANMVQVEADVAKAILAASQQSEQALKEAERRGEYEIKKAVVRVALADAAAAEKTRDEVRQRWIRFNKRQFCGTEEELRWMKQTLDSKTNEANSKREAANRAEAEANMAKTLLATDPQTEQAVKEANGTRAEKEQVAGPPPLQRNQRLKDVLDKNVMIDFAPGPLKEALDYMAERYKFSFEIDDQAFQKRGIKNISQAKVSGTYVKQPTVRCPAKTFRSGQGHL